MTSLSSFSVSFEVEIRAPLSFVRFGWNFANFDFEEKTLISTIWARKRPKPENFGKALLDKTYCNGNIIGYYRLKTISNVALYKNFESHEVSFQVIPDHGNRPKRRTLFKSYLLESEWVKYQISYQVFRGQLLANWLRSRNHQKIFS